MNDDTDWEVLDHAAQHDDGERHYHAAAGASRVAERAAEQALEAADSAKEAVSHIKRLLDGVVERVEEIAHAVHEAVGRAERAASTAEAAAEGSARTHDANTELVESFRIMAQKFDAGFARLSEAFSAPRKIIRDNDGRPAGLEKR